MANATAQHRQEQIAKASPEAKAATNGVSANGKFMAVDHKAALAELQAALAEAKMPFAWPDGRFGAPNAPRVKHAWYECVRTRNLG